MEELLLQNELSWLTRIRIVIAYAIGVLVILYFPIQPVQTTANNIFSFLNPGITPSYLMIWAAVSLALGFIVSAVCTPYGFYIGSITVPAALSVWAFKSSDLSNLFQADPAASSRLAIYSVLRFESFAWLVLVLFGFAGAFAAEKLLRRKQLDLPDNFQPAVKLQPSAAIGLTIIGTTIIASYLLNFLAADISYPDPKVGHITGQPANIQIAFAVLISFMACAFAAKLYLGVSYIWPSIATAFVTLFTIIAYAKSSTLGYMAQSWAAVYFSKTSISIWPIQVVAFGTLGSIWGYWLAARYRYWREFESK
ncbi:MAG: hypothetical protein ABFD79_06815 [Phycisphaerales bacterium]